MWEQRRGGTMPSSVLAPTAAPYPETLDTTRLDGGLVSNADRRSIRLDGALVHDDDLDVQRWLTLSLSGRVDAHNRYGTFVSPRVSALLRGGPWTSRVSVGSGFFAPSALTEEAEAAGLARLTIREPLRAERGRSASLDVTHAQGPLSLTATVFRFEVRDPAVVDRATYTLSTLSEPTINTGVSRNASACALQRHRDVCVRALARGCLGLARRYPADTQAQRRAGRHVGA